MWNLKYDRNQHMYEGKQTQKSDLWFPRARGGKDWEFGISNYIYIYIYIYIMVNIEKRRWDGKGFWKMAQN